MLPIFAGLLILGGVLFFLYKDRLFPVKNTAPNLDYLKQIEAENQQSELVPTTIPTFLEASDEAKLATASAKLSSDVLDKLSIQILNGSGIAGQAGIVQTALEDYGFSKVIVGNSRKTTSSKTQVIFKPQVVNTTRKAILDLLRDLSFDYTIQDSQGTDYDVVITTSLQTTLD